MKKKILFLALGVMFFLNGFSQTSLNLGYCNDSIIFYGCPYGTMPVMTEFTIVVNASGYNPTDTIIYTVFFGDGAYQSIEVLYNNLIYYQYGSIMHTYLNPGIYDVTYIISDLNGNADTLFHPAEIILTNSCSDLHTYIFVDNNSNCIYDNGDSLINNVSYSLYNGTSVYGIFSSIFSISSIPYGINYTAMIDVNAIQQLGYYMSCPVSGFTNFTSSGSDTIYFAIDCNSNYDLSVVSSGGPFKINSSSLISVGVNDISCLPQSGTYTLTLDPSISFVYALNPPTTGSGQIYSWDFSNLVTIGTGQGSIFNMMYFNLDPSVQIGDTICYSFSVTPTAGDINISNNSINLCYQAVGAWDPNHKEVYPKGYGPNGSISPNTSMIYTIGFQNTGNTTATDVYLLDTIDPNLDINSLQIIYASHPMQLYIIDGNILKFDFRNIMLPDSGSNQILSNGYVVYKIDQEPNLSTGTQIKNKAGIYFDCNPAVITNETLNTIEIPSSVNDYIKNNPFFSIMPNPANDKIEISIDRPIFEVHIFDLYGKKILKENNNKTIDIHKLSPGTYIVKVNSGETSGFNKIIIY
ncbi:MAG: T9SS type A sorting domain-containing protein [Bacteroidota bacterium]